MKHYAFIRRLEIKVKTKTYKNTVKIINPLCALDESKTVG